MLENGCMNRFSIAEDLPKLTRRHEKYRKLNIALHFEIVRKITETYPKITQGMLSLERYQSCVMRKTFKLNTALNEFVLRS